ncbi:MAG: hypothetical protein WC178_05615 [Candidatus Paceibacterota bacterium]
MIMQSGVDTIVIIANNNVGSLFFFIFLVTSIIPIKISEEDTTKASIKKRTMPIPNMPIIAEIAVKKRSHNINTSKRLKAFDFKEILINSLTLLILDTPVFIIFVSSITLIRTIRETNIIESAITKREMSGKLMSEFKKKRPIKTTKTTATKNVISLFITEFTFTANIDKKNIIANIARPTSVAD